MLSSCSMEVFIVVDTRTASPILNIGITAIQRRSWHAVDVQTEGPAIRPMILLTEPTGGCDLPVTSYSHAAVCVPSQRNGPVHEQCLGWGGAYVAGQLIGPV